MSIQNTIAVIGGGAAGFFAAINTAHANEHSRAVIFEKSGKVLAKVKISGGGRCNVTNHCFDNNLLTDSYPRGNKELRNVFARFAVKDTIEWFEKKNVKLKTEPDGRMFPVTDNSQTIINCLLNESANGDIEIRKGFEVLHTETKPGDGFIIHFKNGESFSCNSLIVTAGGSPHLKNYDWIKQLGHTIVAPVPSLFTFNVPGSPLKGLEGISVPDVEISLGGSKLRCLGPLLITHWGISGPAVLKLSAFAARYLNEVNYNEKVFVNWMPHLKEEKIKMDLLLYKKDQASKKVISNSIFGLPQRLWERFCELSVIGDKENFADLSKQKLSLLVSAINNTSLAMSGKTTFKEEFVTCGGVALNEINFQTMESKKVKGLFFAGEVLDIDGITGGFNFQAAWSTGFLAGISAAKAAM